VTSGEQFSGTNIRQVIQCAPVCDGARATAGRLARLPWAPRTAENDPPPEASAAAPHLARQVYPGPRSRRRYEINKPTYQDLSSLSKFIGYLVRSSRLDSPRRRGTLREISLSSHDEPALSRKVVTKLFCGYL
jgi:hypothetical protein